MTPKVEHRDYGTVKYDDEGKPVCHICGRSFKKLLGHVTAIHEMSEREYKLTYGLDLKKGIICEATRDRLRQAVMDNIEQAQHNLKRGWEKAGFKKGSAPGRVFTSEQTRRKIVQTNQSRAGGPT